ncbi:MAG: hypothetical protein EOP87_04100 [Verrucomicrobiaceae bacterium]|nr:MAG: hypothetical protein EOP87_04100 [Verrucomicrobiaceae bacterium]
MNLKTLSFTTLTLAAALLPADAFFRAGFKIDKEYRQGPSGAPVFRSGKGDLYVVDGILTVTGCANNGIPVPFGIDTTIGCNIGSNGVSFDGDGTPVPEYKEIVGVEAASTVEPGRHDLVSLYARPSFDFPQDGLGVASISTVLFFDLLSANGDIREYRLAGRGLRGNQFVPGYRFIRNYGPGDRGRMEREIVPGVYLFRFPMINRPTTPLYLNFPVRATVEGFVEKPIRGGFRFTGVGPFSPSGFAQYDVNLISEFRWEGLNQGGVSSGDRLYISFRPLSGLGNNPDAPLIVVTDANGFETFPNDFPPVPNVRILLPSPVQNFYNLPPGFFAVGDNTVLELTLERDPRVGLSAVSTRRFQLPITFVAGFPGAMAAAFPKDTPAALMEKNADPDGDGVSNWLEWLSGSDPYTANAPASLSQLAFVPPTTRRSGQTTPGYWHMSIDRRAGLPAGVSVTVESSTDLESWAPVEENDPHWLIEDIRTEPRIRILSRTPELTDKRYFRVKYNDPG